MVYSLARFRHCQPQPPFDLGGRFESENGAEFLSDAIGRVQITGDPLEALEDGRFVTVHVIRLEDAKLVCDRVCAISPCEIGGKEKNPTHVVGFAEFVECVRGFFRARGLAEIFTPTLVTCPGLEPSLEPFRTEVARGRETQTVYLPTSPEIHLKKALTEGWTDIFEIKSCFRKGEFSPHHENEFTMLEWYRAFADLEMIKADLKALVMEFGVAQVYERTFHDLFEEFLDFQLTPNTQREELAALCRKQQLYFTAEDTFDDLFHRLMIDRLEPRLVEIGPLIVRDFPPSQAALAKLTDEGWADRFEFYWNGFEIANAFNEVTDPLEQKKRWQHETEERARLGTSPLPMDESLLRGFAACGVPPTGGIALGVERLYMALHQVRDIRALKLFSTEDLFVV